MLIARIFEVFPLLSPTCGGQMRHTRLNDFAAHWLASRFPLSTLRSTPRGVQRMTRGLSDSPFLPSIELSFINYCSGPKKYEMSVRSAPVETWLVRGNPSTSSRRTAVDIQTSQGRINRNYRPNHHRSVTSTRRLRGSSVSSGVGTSRLRLPCDSMAIGVLVKPGARNCPAMAVARCRANAALASAAP